MVLVLGIRYRRPIAPQLPSDNYNFPHSSQGIMNNKHLELGFDGTLHKSSFFSHNQVLDLVILLEFQLV